MVLSRTFLFATVLVFFLFVLLQGSKVLSLSIQERVGSVNNISALLAGKSVHLLPWLYMERLFLLLDTGACPPTALDVGAKVLLKSNQIHYVTMVLHVCFKKNMLTKTRQGRHCHQQDRP